MWFLLVDLCFVLPTYKDHLPILHVLQLTDTSMLRLLPLDRHADYVKELGFVWCHPQGGVRRTRETLSTVHLNLFHGLECFFVDGFSAVGLAQDVSQRYLGVSKETNLEVSVARDAQPIAGAAEIMRHARDEAETAFKAGDFPSLTCVILPVSDLLQSGIFSSDHVQHLIV
jgi:hypothetical protein